VQGSIIESQTTPSGKISGGYHMQKTNVENFDGYVVHSYYVECPYTEGKNESRRKNVFLRYFAFAALAPLAILADSVVAIFQ
jgi:hypothetical protein